jgi:hypothetical protein
MLTHTASELRSRLSGFNLLIFLFGRAMGQMYECQAQTYGALLSLPHGGHSEDVIRTKLFGDYIRDNVDSWFRWSKRGGFPIERMDDLILVTGCTLVTSWAAAVFDNSKMSKAGLDSATISLNIRKSNRGGAHFFWRNDRGNVDYHNSYFDPVSFPGYRPEAMFSHHVLYFSFIILDCRRSSAPESMRFRQGLPSKAYSLPDQTNASCSRTPS